MSFDKNKYTQRIQELTARAKEGNGYTMDCDIGETAYLEVLLLYIKEWKSNKVGKDTLIKKQKELENKLLSYYQHREMFDSHIQINNKYSHILTEAEKNGCLICKKLVRVFDGREPE
jgi:hypothetical protein